MSTSLYLIQSIDNGRVYVGVSGNPRRRWQGHCSDMRRIAHLPLYRSMKKYGPDRHQLSVVESYSSQAEALDAEVWWIQYLKAIGAALFNRSLGGDGSSGHQKSEETRRRMSESRKGKCYLSEDGRARIAVAARRRRGIALSSEVKERLAAAHRGKRHSEESRIKIAAILRSRLADPAAREKLLTAISKAHKGKPKSAEQRAKNSAAHRARWTDEMRAEMSARQKGRPRSAEHRAALSRALKGRPWTEAQHQARAAARERKRGAK